MATLLNICCESDMMHCNEVSIWHCQGCVALTCCNLSVAENLIINYRKQFHQGIAI